MAVDLTLVLSAFLVAAVLAFALALRYHVDRVGKLREDLEWAREERLRLARDRSGPGAQWAPLLSGYPYDPRGFRFVGSPVEGVQFEPDRIVFVSLGTTPRADAERVRDLVRAGRVEFTEAGTAAAAPAPPSTSGEASAVGP